jgi:hypothetical protein
MLASWAIIPLILSGLPASRTIWRTDEFLKSLSGSLATLTAAQPNFMIAAGRRCCSKTWRKMRSEPDECALGVDLRGIHSAFIFIKAKPETPTWASRATLHSRSQFDLSKEWVYSCDFWHVPGGGSYPMSLSLLGQSRKETA